VTDLVPILRKMFLTSHRYVPTEGEAPHTPEEYVTLTGRISPDELAILIEALKHDAQRRDERSTPEPTQ
jgi:hypothetical protein